MGSCDKKEDSGVLLKNSLGFRKRQWHPTPVLLPGKSHGQGSLVGCSPWGRKSQTQLSNFTLTFHFHALEKEMATHSSVLAWRIPRTGEAGGLPSMGSHRVGHDWSDLAAVILLFIDLGCWDSWTQMYVCLIKQVLVSIFIVLGVLFLCFYNQTV